MEKVIGFLVEFLIVFIVVYLIYYLFVVKSKKSKDKIKNSLECKYLITKYKINLDKIEFKFLAKRLAFSNSIIISIAFMIISFIKNYFLKLLVGFIILFPLMIIVYHILGKALKKKEGNLNV